MGPSPVLFVFDPVRARRSEKLKGQVSREAGGEGSCPQETRRMTSQLNDSGRRQGPWIRFHDNGTKSEEGAFDDGLEDGPWTWYHPNGQKRKEGTYVRGVRQGLWTWYYEDGQKDDEGHFENDLEQGLWTGYHENGQKSEEVHYHEGREEGLVSGWNDDGTPIGHGHCHEGERLGEWTLWHWGGGQTGGQRETGHYEDGLKTGVWIRWHVNGNHKYEEGAYTKDERDGPWTRYYTNGAKYEEGVYKDGERDGKWTRYTACGDVLEETPFRQGREHGRRIQYYVNGLWETVSDFEDGVLQKETLYFDNGEKEEERTYKDGEPHGVWRTWTSEGDKESETPYHEGEKHGVRLRWDDEGLEERTYYEHGKKQGKGVRGLYPNPIERDGGDSDEESEEQGSEDGSITWEYVGTSETDELYGDGVGDAEGAKEAGDRTVPRGRRDGKWTLSWKQGARFQLLLDECVRAEGSYKDGKREGLWTWFSKSGAKQREVVYKGGKKDGVLTRWYLPRDKKTGELGTELVKAEEIHYEMGEVVKWTTFYDNGVKEEEIPKRKGVTDGLSRSWYRSGQKCSEEYRVRGELDGRETIWHPNGNLYAEVDYCDDRRTKIVTLRDENGGDLLSIEGELTGWMPGIIEDGDHEKEVCVQVRVPADAKRVPCISTGGLLHEDRIQYDRWLDGMRTSDRTSRLDTGISVGSAFVVGIIDDKELRTDFGEVRMSDDHDDTGALKSYTVGSELRSHPEFQEADSDESFGLHIYRSLAELQALVEMFNKGRSQRKARVRPPKGSIEEEESDEESPEEDD